MPKITPCLWFDGQAEQAMKFYATVFKNSKLGAISRYGEAGPGPKGQALVVQCTLDGQPFMGLNGGPQFTFSEAISFVVECKTQAELNGYWSKLSKGGKIQQCGWLKDKFGVSWQIVPAALGKLMGGKDPERSNRVMQALLKMKKLDIKKLEKAYGKK